MGEYRYPDFICIGAQKAGTTWLDHNLRRHPRLWLPPVKEMQYFNEIYLPENRKWTARHRVETGAKRLRRYIEKMPAGEWDDRHVARLADIASGAMSDEWYGRIFNLAPPGRICGEITPDYSTLPEVGIRHIVKLSPEVKIVFLLRDPVERSWSHIRMIVRTQRITDLSAIERLARNGDLLRRGNYSAIVEAWTKIVPTKRFHVAFMDDIVDNPRAVLEAICAFLGIQYRDRFFKKADKAIHVGEAQPIPPSVTAILKKQLRPAYDGIVARYPEKGAAWMARHFG